MTACKCKLPSDQANVPEANVLLGERANILYFCPLCGDKITVSRREELFPELIPEEQTVLKSRLVGVKTIDEVIAILGKPDVDFCGLVYDPKDQVVYGYRGVTRTIKYKHLAKTIIVTAQELEDGRLQIVYTPQLQKPEETD